MNIVVGSLPINAIVKHWQQCYQAKILQLFIIFDDDNKYGCDEYYVTNVMSIMQLLNKN
jgi:hypothetical protein